MKHTLTLLLLVIFLFRFGTNSIAQCNLTNSTTCVCPNGTNDCDLLPDIQLSWWALMNYQGGPTEYSQTGNGANDGRLRITGSTPNTGAGPFTVFSHDSYGMKTIICGTDTFSTPAGQAFTCPNGATPKQLLYQRIYHKNSNDSMTYWEHVTPPMTYSNSSLYVDEWGIFSLRLQDSNEPSPLNWPIVGTGKKRAFCLMDYGSCSTYNNMCKDDNTTYLQGTTLLNGDFPNHGLGNGYSCSPVEQGISSGFTDIYSENLDGMWINIPPGTCNGDYWIVYEVDPHNYFVESDETNNWTAVPYTLALQDAPGNPVATISSSGNSLICGNDSVTLTANPGFTYLWSNGATTRSIKVPAGTYQVVVTNHCGTAVSPSFVVTGMPFPPDPSTTGDTVCYGNPATLYAMGNNIHWYDNNQTLLGTGNTFLTPALTVNTTYFARDELLNPGVILNTGKSDSSGGGGNFTGSQYLIFDALKSFTLKSVKVYASTAGPRTIEVRNSSGVVIQTGLFNIPIGESTVLLNFDIPQGIDYQITVNGTPDLWRSNGGVNYPYLIADTVSIKNSSAGTGFYYFFYNWEIEVGKINCASGEVAAEATVIVCTGISQNALDKQLTIYPNPANKQFTIEWKDFPAELNLTIALYDALGKNMLREQSTIKPGLNKQNYDLTGIPKGIYQLHLLSSDGNSYHRKLIVQ